MSFLYPGFLYALLLIAIPIVVHLFNFRKYKTVYFSNTRLIKQVQESRKSTAKIKNIIILIFRILALAFLIIAFARPYFNNEKKSEVNMGGNISSIYIDNSFSMNALSQDGTLLSQAIATAREMIHAFSESEKIQIVSNHFTGQDQILLTKEEALLKLDEIESSPNFKTIPQIILRQKALLDQTKKQIGKTIYLLSDFQRNTLPSKALQLDEFVPIKILQFKAQNQSNLFIDSVWFSKPFIKSGDNIDLLVRIVNHSDQNYESVPMQVSINKEQKSLASFDIESGTSKNIPMSFLIQNTGWNQIRVSIEDHAITYDDDFYLSVNAYQKAKILIISDKKEPLSLQNVFSTDPFFECDVASLEQLDYAEIKNYNAIILNQLQDIPSGLSSQIVEFIGNGYSACIIPSSKLNFQDYNKLLNTLEMGKITQRDSGVLYLNKINLAHSFFADVFEKIPENMDLPFCNIWYKVENDNHKNLETLIEFENGLPYLNYTAYKLGSVLLFTSPIDKKEGNITKNALFVPILYKSILNGLKIEKPYLTIGKDEFITMQNHSNKTESTPHLINSDLDLDIIPEIRPGPIHTQLYWHNQITNPGFYNISEADSSIQTVAFNYERKESELEFASEKEIQLSLGYDSKNENQYIDMAIKKPASISNTVNNKNDGLWPWLILLSLLCFGVETAIIRTAK